MCERYSIASIIAAIKNLEQNVFYIDPRTGISVGYPKENSLRIDLINKKGGGDVAKIEKAIGDVNSIINDGILTQSTTEVKPVWNNIQTSVNGLYDMVKPNDKGVYIDTSDTTTINKYDTLLNTLQSLYNATDARNIDPNDQVHDTEIYDTLVDSVQSIYNFIRNGANDKKIISITSDETGSYKDVLNSIQSLYNFIKNGNEGTQIINTGSIPETVTEDYTSVVSTLQTLYYLVKKLEQNKHTIVDEINIFDVD